MLDSRYADSGLWEFFISGQGGIVCMVINSYVDGERWSGNLLNMISKFATPEEYTLRIDHISVMLVDTPEKLKEKQEVFFEANKKKPDGIIYLGVNGWAFMRDKIREKWGDIPTLVCSETGEMAENECYFNQRHSSDRVIPLQEAVKGITLRDWLSLIMLKVRSTW